VATAAEDCLSFRRKRSPTVRRIGFLFAGTIAERPQAQEFWRTLERLGYVEGKNLKTEMREARGQKEMIVGSAYEGTNVDNRQELLLNFARHHCQAIQTIID
jgi:hypothetical protein